MSDLEYLKKYYNGNIEDAIKKLKQGIPVQYIVGNVDFYGLEFDVNESTLIPRFETEGLVEEIINLSKNKKNLKILDIGTGSGCIAITLSKLLNAKVTAVDICNQALEQAKKNAKKNNVDITLIQSDLFSNVDGVFDIIVSNPPYIAYDEKIMDIVSKNEPAIALYAPNNGLYFYEEILKEASNYLSDSFLIAFEIGYNQSREITNYAKKYLKNIKVITKKDLNGFDRYIYITKGE